MRGLRGLFAFAAVAIGCGGAERRPIEPAPVDTHAAVPQPAPIVRHPGATVRVAIVRTKAGFDGFAAVWLHHETGQDERLAIQRDGAFDWRIDRNGTQCEIAGTVALVTVPVDSIDQQALAWTMTLNNCNQSYQGKTANDIVISHDDDHLVIKDADFQLDPVPYDRER